MNRFKKWAEHEYSKKQRMIAVVFGGVVFLGNHPILYRWCVVVY